MARRTTTAQLAKEVDTLTEQSKINFTSIAKVGDRAASIEKDLESVRLMHDSRIRSLEGRIDENVTDRTFGQFVNQITEDVNALKQVSSPNTQKKINADIGVLKSKVHEVERRVVLSMWVFSCVAAALLVIKIFL